MKSVLSDALLNTTAQINLNDSYAKPSETNVSVFLYEAGTKDLKYTFMHTLNFKGRPDTLTVIDPELRYDMVVNTLPQVVVKNVQIHKNQHNILPADCPQGILMTRIKGTSKSSAVKIRVSQAGKAVTLNVQNINEAQRYLVGNYDLEILTLPRIYKPNTTISQSAYTYIDIPGSGLFKYKTYNQIVGQIFINSGDRQDEWVCDLDPEKLTDSYFLQPGQYKVIYRLKSAVSTDYTTVKTFSVQAGENTIINL